MFHVSWPSKRSLLGKHVNLSFLQFIATDHLALAAGCAAGVGMCFFFCGVQLFARQHPSSCAPRVAISATAPGFAAVAGKATGQRTLPLPSAEGHASSIGPRILQLQESAEDKDKKEWKNVAEETGHLTFFIEDETGQLLVEPSGAELDLRQNISEEYSSQSSSSPQPLDEFSDRPSNNQSSGETVPRTFTNFLVRNGISLDRPTCVEEYCLEPETPIVVTGTVIKNDAMHADSLASIFP